MSSQVEYSSKSSLGAARRWRRCVAPKWQGESAPSGVYMCTGALWDQMVLGSGGQLRHLRCEKRHEACWPVGSIPQNRENCARRTVVHPVLWGWVSGSMHICHHVAFLTSALSLCSDFSSCCPSSAQNHPTGPGNLCEAHSGPLGTSQSAIVSQLNLTKAEQAEVAALWRACHAQAESYLNNGDVIPTTEVSAQP